MPIHCLMTPLECRLPLKEQDKALRHPLRVRQLLCRRASVPRCRCRAGEVPPILSAQTPTSTKDCRHLERRCSSRDRSAERVCAPHLRCKTPAYFDTLSHRASSSSKGRPRHLRLKVWKTEIVADRGDRPFCRQVGHFLTGRETLDEQPSRPWLDASQHANADAIIIFSRSHKVKQRPRPFSHIFCQIAIEENVETPASSPAPSRGRFNSLATRLFPPSAPTM